VAPFEASNAASAGAASRVAEALRAATAHADRRLGLVALLDHLRHATGAERAFLVEAGGSARPGRVLATSACAGRDEPQVSWGAASRALAAERPLFVAEAAAGTAMSAVSFRALSLSTAAAIAVPRTSGPRTILLVDARGALAIDRSTWEAAAPPFAALAALLLEAGRCAPPVPKGGFRTPRLLGSSPAMRGLIEEIDRVAQVPLPALILGPTGSGKELVARALHERGPRAASPFVAVNCAAIPESLLERELFGAVRGAYTGADADHAGLFRRASGGTIFLDEVGDMPSSLQAKLLRVLQHGTVRPLGGVDEAPVDVRVVAATHRDLTRLSADGRFREDLFFRLAILVLRVPSLAERAEDLRILAEDVVAGLAARCGLPQTRLTAAAVEALSCRPWPGNVREMEGVLARALVRAAGRAIEPDDLDFGPVPDPAAHLADRPDLERAMIVHALARSDGTLAMTAARLGWSRQKLHRRMRVLGVPRPRPPGRDGRTSR